MIWRKREKEGREIDNRTLAFFFSLNFYSKNNDTVKNYDQDNNNDNYDKGGDAKMMIVMIIFITMLMII